MLEENQTSGAQPDVSGTQNQENETLTGADRDYKKDMLKFKDLYTQSQSRIQNLEKRLDDRDIESAKTQGDKDKVIETLQQKLRASEDAGKKTTYKAARVNVENELKLVAKDMGCVDTGMLIRLLGSDRIDKITVDSGLRPDIGEVKDLVNDSMKEFENIRLFTKNVKVPDLTPNNEPVLPQGQPKDAHELSDEELKSKILALPGEKRIADLR